MDMFIQDLGGGWAALLGRRAVHGADGADRSVVVFHAFLITVLATALLRRIGRRAVLEDGAVVYLTSLITALAMVLATGLVRRLGTSICRGICCCKLGWGC
jgi:hypothetical protein